MMMVICMFFFQGKTIGDSKGGPNLKEPLPLRPRDVNARLPFFCLPYSWNALGRRNAPDARARALISSIAGTLAHPISGSYGYPVDEPRP